MKKFKRQNGINWSDPLGQEIIFVEVTGITFATKSLQIWNKKDTIQEQLPQDILLAMTPWSSLLQFPSI